jgi:hypothetical protein
MVNGFAHLLGGFVKIRIKNSNIFKLKFKIEIRDYSLVIVVSSSIKFDI